MDALGAQGFIEHTMDAMAASKLNVLHMHITDDQSFPIESTTVPQPVNIHPGVHLGPSPYPRGVHALEGTAGSAARLRVRPPKGEGGAASVLLRSTDGRTTLLALC